jgi:hypothetical protein
MKTSYLSLRNVIAGCKILVLNSGSFFFLPPLHNFMFVAVLQFALISPSDSLVIGSYLTWHHMTIGGAASTTALYSEDTRFGSGDEML